MQRESFHTVSHFLDDASFREWVLTGVGDEDWSRWLENNPHKSQLAREARNILLALGTHQGGPSFTETEHALTESWKRINDLGKEAIWSRLRWKIPAAILLLALGLSWYIFTPGKENLRRDPQQSSSSTVATNNMAVYNNTGAAQVINLEDGSSIILQPGGKITHPAVFDSSSREVYLSGEAFFEISKNPRRPFLVFTNDLVTKVVGTSFRIKAIDGQPQVEVFVKTGEVNVRQIKAAGNEPKEIALQPNESVSFLKEYNTFEKSIAGDIPKRAVEYLSFEFADAPVAEIFRTIEVAYGLSVEYPEELLRNCYLSTSLADEPLLEKLKIICESIGGDAAFIIDEHKVIIKSNGCN